jgi:23S rRNA pseudouridine955/2504/2580 synthase/23S rRNA pseudouridine1911/1915/1917 synthase
MDMMAAVLYRFARIQSKQNSATPVSRLPWTRRRWQQGRVQRRIQFQLPRAYAGATLLDFLVRRFPYHDAAGWGARLVQNRVHVNGQAADAARVLAPGDLVEYLASDLPEPRVNLDVTILFEDDDLLAVNKPPNLPSHPGGRYFQHTLWAVLKTRFGLEQPVLINRLDRETSGVTLIAKTDKAGKFLRAEFSTRRVEKKYLALVEGEFPERVETRGLLVPDPDSPVKKKMKFIAADAAPADAASQWCETVFQRLETVGAGFSRDWNVSPSTFPSLGKNGENFSKPWKSAGPVSLLEARPLTGRLHQLRATLHALGFPVVGDKLYGHDPAFFTRFCQDQLTDDDRARLRLDRQALHAASLRLRHPRTRRTLELEAPLPADMAALLAALRSQAATSAE